MIKIFISHKQEDSYTANKIANELKAMNIPYYLDVLDFSATGNGKEITDHINKISMIGQILLPYCRNIQDIRSGFHSK